MKNWKLENKNWKLGKLKIKGQSRISNFLSDRSHRFSAIVEAANQCQYLSVIATIEYFSFLFSKMR